MAPDPARPTPKERNDVLAAWRGISPDPEMQMDPVALELDVVQLYLAVLFAPGLVVSHRRCK
jgi:hypothetical protein